MKRIFTALVAVGLLIGVAAAPAAAAPGGVQRNQITTTVDSLSLGNGHT